MKKNAIFTIFKKELVRFFTDRRTLIALILPGILLYTIYSLMGGAMSNLFMPDEEYEPIIYSVNTPTSLGSLFDSAGLELDEVDGDVEKFKQRIEAGDADLLIVFPENFDEKIVEYSPSLNIPAPNIEIYYSSSSTYSTSAYQTVLPLLDAFESSLANKFDINNLPDTKFDLASESDITSMIFSMMMPMLLIMLLFSGCMAVAPESIAGEKERGTVAALLITPAKRSHIAIGKILALSVLALISGTSSTIGVLLSLPKLMGESVNIDGSVYNAGDYAMLALVILSTVLVFITLISIVSAYAKTVKEATSYITPLMMLSMMIGLTGMFGSAATAHALYLIPIYNSVQCMIAIFSFEANVVNTVLTVISNLILTCTGVFILTRMFNSEKIMFNK